MNPLEPLFHLLRLVLVLLAVEFGTDLTEPPTRHAEVASYSGVSVRDATPSRLDKGDRSLPIVSAMELPQEEGFLLVSAQPFVLGTEILFIESPVFLEEEHIFGLRWQNLTTRALWESASARGPPTRG